jgi:uncharacterized protein YjbI with pentapeptide repeats
LWDRFLVSANFAETNLVSAKLDEKNLVSANFDETSAHSSSGLRTVVQLKVFFSSHLRLVEGRGEEDCTAVLNLVGLKRDTLVVSAKLVSANVCCQLNIERF